MLLVKHGRLLHHHCYECCFDVLVSFLELFVEKNSKLHHVDLFPGALGHVEMRGILRAYVHWDVFSHSAERRRRLNSVREDEVKVPVNRKL